MAPTACSGAWAKALLVSVPARCCLVLRRNYANCRSEARVAQVLERSRSGISQDKGALRSSRKSQKGILSQAQYLSGSISSLCAHAFDFCNNRHVTLSRNHLHG